MVQQRRSRVPVIEGEVAPLLRDPEIIRTLDAHNCSPTPSFVDGHEAQVVVRTERSEMNGKLVDFALMLQIRPEESDAPWFTVTSVDCAHNEIHVHKTDLKGNGSRHPELVPSDCRGDLDKAFQWALDYIWDVQERMGERDSV